MDKTKTYELVYSARITTKTLNKIDPYYVLKNNKTDNCHFFLLFD
jgi:hypothetical protein